MLSSRYLWGAILVPNGGIGSPSAVLAVNIICVKVPKSPVIHIPIQGSLSTPSVYSTLSSNSC